MCYAFLAELIGIILEQRDALAAQVGNSESCGASSIAASCYAETSEETMTLVPLTVTGTATPVAATPVAPAGVTRVAVRLQMTDDLRYIVTPDPVPGGPRI